MIRLISEIIICVGRLNLFEFRCRRVRFDWVFRLIKGLNVDFKNQSIESFLELEEWPRVV